MKTAFLTICLFIACYAFAQEQKAAAPNSDVKAAPGSTVSAAKIDPAKEADIRQLLRVTGASDLAVQSMTAMEKNIRPLMSNSLPPGPYRTKLIDLFFDKFHSRTDPKEFVELAIPVYDKYFTDEEIKGLMDFYQTPLGQKALHTLPNLLSEMQQRGQEWGGQLGRQCMQEVLAENPDLAKQLEEASSKSVLPK